MTHQTDGVSSPWGGDEGWRWCAKETSAFSGLFNFLKREYIPVLLVKLKLIKSILFLKRRKPSLIFIHKAPGRARESLRYKQNGALGDLSENLLSGGRCGCHGDGCLHCKPSCAPSPSQCHAFKSWLTNSTVIMQSPTLTEGI